MLLKMKAIESGITICANDSNMIFNKRSVTYRFCPREASYGGWGFGACDVSRRKIVGNFKSLFKIFNILKSSIQSIQNTTFS